MEKYIHITKEVRDHLKKTYHVSGMTLWKALYYKSTSELANKIRRDALEHYGIVMTIIPELECFHDHDNYMRQYLPNGAMLEFDKTNGGGDVFFKGRKVRHYDSVEMREIPAIQKWAATLR